MGKRITNTQDLEQSKCMWFIVRRPYSGNFFSKHRFFFEVMEYRELKRYLKAYEVYEDIDNA